MVFRRYCIQNVKDGIQIHVCKIINDSVNLFSQFIPAKVKKKLRKSQAQFREMLRKLRLRQNNDFLIKKTCTQHALLRVIETICMHIDQSGVCSMVMMDLLKAYVCLLHDLLVAKMEAYGLRIDSLKLMHSYLVGRRQRVNIGTSVSTWQEIKSGVPKGSVLGSFLLNLFRNDFFYEIQHSQVCNFADDNTIYACGKNLDSFALNIESGMKAAMCWYKNNETVANPEKFRLTFIGLKDDIKLCGASAKER